ncbi:hypothetical protein SDC9_122068 [bioreactor metagenome]|uniref:Uncharacterized protein n=1 Tax=bioreactor metagenome TaxID=1076179 RepID=A0A645CDQ1_9ZZZZ
MDHLDEVAGAVRADPGATGLVAHMGGDGLQHRADDLVAFRGAAGHDGRAGQGAVLAAGHAGADEVEALGRDLLLAADGVAEVGIAGVQNDVAGLEIGKQLLDGRVSGGTGLDHDDDGARMLDRGHEIGDRLRTDELALVAVIGQDLLSLGVGAIEDRNGEPLVGEVTGQV